MGDGSQGRGWLCIELAVARPMDFLRCGRGLYWYYLGINPPNGQSRVLYFILV